ncbi:MULTISPECIES: hypothetical protein [Bacillus cereus group]|uniref:hypothetical protein n=1 Tax=Bacillus cereus group TaxID=86661 RepID=UPI0021D31AE3|nr:MULTISPECIES: hypothetical protein [Bacillus cereus group]MCU5201645.1 hypothetical protein [Bacillus paranthracis]MCU5374671.1 hypothetical protein [Bacillus pacificus]
MEDCLFCRKNENISIIDTIPLCEGCCDTYQKTENKVELIESHIKRERQEMDAARNNWGMRMYVLDHNGARHLFDTDEDCIFYKELAYYHLGRIKMLINHPFVRLKYLFIEMKKGG